MNKEQLILAPGVTFEELRHEYFFRGKKLSGVTGLITKGMFTKAAKDFLSEVCGEGNHVHAAVQNWLNVGEFETVHPGAIWVRDMIRTLHPDIERYGHAEVLVSDMKKYASAVDIVYENKDGSVALYDIKRTFRRKNVTLQLSIYKYFIEQYSGRAVSETKCLAFRDRVAYTVYPVTSTEVEELLYGQGASDENRGGVF